MSTNPLIIALDNVDIERAHELIELLADHVWGFKFNDLLFDPGIHRLTETFGDRTRFMIDAKLHDIPNTMANQVRRLKALRPSLLTAHASASSEGIQAAAEELRRDHPEDSTWPRLAAVTVLTSLDDTATRNMFHANSSELVRRLGRLATDAGATAIVCSGQELRLFSHLENYTLIVPGIRPAWYTQADDQKRKMTPARAMEEGATHLVMGRPILRDADPVAAVTRTMKEIHGSSFIAFAETVGALSFETTELKSGRMSPYFFNTGKFAYRGEWTRKLGEAYATAIRRHTNPDYRNHQIIVGPAYKGIPLAVATAEVLGVPYAFDRKEEKAHGDGGEWVGVAPGPGNRVVIVDDVITSGTTKHEIIKKVRATGATVDAVVVAFDRQEKGEHSPQSAVQELTDATGVPVYSLACLQDLETELASRGRNRELEAVRAYSAQFGVC